MCPLNNIFQVSEESQPDEETTESSEWNAVSHLGRSSSIPNRLLLREQSQHLLSVILSCLILSFL